MLTIYYQLIIYYYVLSSDHIDSYNLPCLRNNLRATRCACDRLGLPIPSDLPPPSSEKICFPIPRNFPTTHLTYKLTNDHKTHMRSEKRMKNLHEIVPEPRRLALTLKKKRITSPFPRAARAREFLEVYSGIIFKIMRIKQARPALSLSLLHPSPRDGNCARFEREYNLILIIFKERQSSVCRHIYERARENVFFSLSLSCSARREREELHAHGRKANAGRKERISRRKKREVSHLPPAPVRN